MENKDRIVVDKLIKDCPLCNQCPAKIFQKETDKIKYGFGSLFAKIMFVLPIEAYKNKHAKFYLENICWKLINEEDVYITYHPKCKVSSPVEEYGGKCKHFLFYEINKIKPDKIIFFGVDIPKELYDVPTNQTKLYKFNNILSIYYDNNRLLDIRNKLKQIL